LNTETHDDHEARDRERERLCCEVPECSERNVLIRKREKRRDRSEVPEDNNKNKNKKKRTKKKNKGKVGI
jgi:hypothetical protein